VIQGNFCTRSIRFLRNICWARLNGRTVPQGPSATPTPSGGPFVVALKKRAKRPPRSCAPGHAIDVRQRCRSKRSHRQGFHRCLRRLNSLGFPRFSRHQLAPPPCHFLLALRVPAGRGLSGSRSRLQTLQCAVAVEPCKHVACPVAGMHPSPGVSDRVHPAVHWRAGVDRIR
jgi:hypothetical protein